MNYQEALAYIHSIPRFAKTNTLERIRDILSALGNPQEHLRFVHVAGTNGKGSTVTMMSSVLHAAGHHVGTFVSPFVYHFLERIQLDLCPVDEDIFAKACGQVRSIVDSMQDQPNFFEILTAIAIMIFHEEYCDYVVLEVGLGGTWDATNVIPSPELAIICSIALDHTDILGSTVEEIAAEKCGIIKEGTSVVTTCLHSKDVRNIIEASALRHHAKLHFSEPICEILTDQIDTTVFRWNDEEYSLSLPGKYQLENTSIVLKACAVLGIPNDAIRLGLATVYFPARMEIISHSPLTIVDGAHNPAGMNALKDSIAELLPNRRICVVFGCLKDKGYAEMTKCAHSMADTFILTQPNSPRAARPQELLPYAPNALICDHMGDAMQKIKSKQPEVVLICGSLYLAGETAPMRTIVETERLILREMIPTDYRDLCEILQDPEVMTAYEHAFSDEEVHAWYFNQRRRYREDGFGLWAVISKETGEMLGQCGLTIQDCYGQSVVEVGYLFKKKHWHHGYATEAAVACKRYAFDVLNKDEVYSIIRDMNTASQNVAKRNEMQKIGTLIKHYYGIDMPHDIYKITR